MADPKQPKPIRGARAPLFERLEGPNWEGAGQGSAQHVYGVLALLESVRRELSKLLNTRCSREDRNATVIDYGIPDFSWMSASSGDDRLRLAQIIERKITAFEPRLDQVRVTLERDATDPRAAIGTIGAELVMESIREPVSFPLLILAKAGAIELAAPVAEFLPLDR